ncbi:unnamed protein product, partial [Linum tenue]
MISNRTILQIKTKTNPLSLIISLFLFFSISPPFHCFKITTQLIHRDSYFSHLYNSTADRARRIIKATLARYGHLISSNDDTPMGVDIEASGTWGIKYNIFYVNLSIGNPPVPQLALMDTVNDLLWVKCPLCSPYSTSSGATYFYSFNSKTYSHSLVTDDVFCLAVVRSKDASVIGMMAQQGYNVGYDLKEMT